MKRYAAIIVLFILVLFSCKKADRNFFEVSEGNGKTVTKEIKTDFDAITVATGIDAEIVKSADEKVVISAPEDIMGKIAVDGNFGKLKIHMKPGLNLSARKIKVKIFARDFTSVEANSSANIMIKDKFTQENTAVSVSSSGSINGELEANNLTVNASSSGDFSGRIWAVSLVSNVSSSGKVNVKGKAKNATVVASSSGSFRGLDVMVENGSFQASSSGDISCSVSTSLVANANSAGSVNVRKTGELAVQTVQENSGGSVNIN